MNNTKITNRCFMIDEYTYNVSVTLTKRRGWSLRLLSIDRNDKTYNILFKTSSIESIDNKLERIILDNLEWIKKQSDKIYDFNLKDNNTLLFGKEVSIKEYEESYNLSIDKIKKLYDELCTMMNVRDIPVRFRSMRTRWGTYNREKGLITLNAGLIHAPLHLIEYVICHELCHHFEFNHKQGFYILLSKYYKDYKNAKKELKRYSQFL